MIKSRFTKQKELIENEISNLKTFFTAEELYNKLKKNNIGIATVYRFLNNLEANHKIHSYNCNRRKTYSINATNHNHFTCENCKKIIHFDVKDISFIKTRLNSRICHFQINVTGLCEECCKKQA